MAFSNFFTSDPKCISQTYLSCHAMPSISPCFFLPFTIIHPFFIRFLAYALLNHDSIQKKSYVGCQNESTNEQRSNYRAVSGTRASMETRYESFNSISFSVRNPAPLFSSLAHSTLPPFLHPCIPSFPTARRHAVIENWLPQTTLHFVNRIENDFTKPHIPFQKLLTQYSIFFNL